MKVKIAQDAKYEGRDWWTWAVWLEADQAELDRVVRVTYILHPTFPHPEMIVTDRDSRFRLDASGWGEFMIRARVSLRGGKSVALKHWLKLSYDAGREGRRRDAVGRAPAKDASPLRSGARAEEGGGVRAAANGTPSIFISYSASDAPAVAQIRRLLKGAVEIVSTEDVALGGSVEESVAQAIRSAEKAIVVVPERMSPFMQQELDLLQERSIQLLPVLVKRNRSIPKMLENHQVIDLTPNHAKAGLDKLMKSVARSPGSTVRSR